MKTLYDFDQYREFINHWISTQPSGGHGIKSKMAAALKCHSAYITLVLKGEAELSLEQGLKLAQYMNLSGTANAGGSETDSECEYFLLLIEQARAGTQELRARFKSKLQELHARRSVLKNRLKTQKMISAQDQARYFSAWYYGAIHLLVTIDPFKTRKAIAQYLQLDSRTLSRALDFLQSTGLIEVDPKDANKFKSGSFAIHLGNDNAQIARHHSNWRLRALQVLDRDVQNSREELHYSSAVTVARADLPRAREILVRAIEDVRAVVRDSKNEDALACYTIDLFEVGNI